MEHYSAIKKKEIVSFASKWTEVEFIVLSEVSQALRTKVICFPSSVEARPKINVYIHMIICVCVHIDT
jgi:hypothetical protein